MHVLAHSTAVEWCSSPVLLPMPFVTNMEAPSWGEVGQHLGITRIPPPLGTVAPVKPGVFPTWGTCIAGDQL